METMEITITLTEAETKALAYVALDPQEWAQNVVKERARLAMEEIFQSEISRMIQDPNIQDIPANIETVVMAAEIASLADSAKPIPDSAPI